MQLDKHTLVNDFPDHQHTIRHLKMNDNHFAKLFNAYHELERRVHLKDQLFNLVIKAEKAL